MALAKGEVVFSPNKAVRENLRHLKANADLFPGKTRLAVPVSFKAASSIESGNVQTAVHVTFKTVDNKMFTTVIKTDTLLSSRAFARLDTGTVSLFSPHALDNANERVISGREDHEFRAILAHESVHPNRSFNSISNALWKVSVQFHRGSLRQFSLTNRTGDKNRYGKEAPRQRGKG